MRYPSKTLGLLGQDPEIPDGGSQGHRAFGGQDIYPFFQGRPSFGANSLLGIAKQGLGIIDVAHQGDPFLYDLPGHFCLHLRIEMKASKPGLGNIFEAIGGITADMEDDGTGKQPCNLLMHREEKISITFRAHQITRGVVCETKEVDARLYLRSGK